jgi:6-phosphogluconate dehydrogenase
MGANIARRLMRGGHEVVGFDSDQGSVSKLVEEGAFGAASLEELKEKLDKPRIFWVMVPAGAPTEETVTALRAIAEPGDVIIDGGNTFFKDSIRSSQRWRQASERSSERPAGRAQIAAPNAAISTLGRPARAIS